MTLYLKYRSQRIADLDLTSVRETLTRMMAGGKIPHAWLFTGPKGIGKTSSARIIAKAVNCTDKRKPSDFEPCNECEMCGEITAGTAVDVTEIDAASNRGIDEMRELRDKVRLAPMRAKIKVYIIDEVHMLTTEAANALLKTLEEPPEKTMFILCTTEAEKLPDTVVSRCTRVMFKRASQEEILGKLTKIVQSEGLTADPAALAKLAAAAGGSFRDGIKMLEQVIANNTVTEAEVDTVLGINQNMMPAELVRQLHQKNRAEALAFVAKLTEEGVNMRRFVERMVEGLREEMLAQIETNPAARPSESLTLIRLLQKAYQQMKESTLVQLPLEMAIIEWTGGDDSAAPVVEKTAEIKPEKVLEKEVKPVERKPETPPKHVEAEATPGTDRTSDVVAKWGEIMKAVRPKNHSIEALLRSTKPIGFDGKKLTLEVFYKFHKDKLETDKCRMIVESSIAEVVGVEAVKLFLTLGERNKPKTEEISAANIGPDIIAAAQEIFKAEVV